MMFRLMIYQYVNFYNKSKNIYDIMSYPAQNIQVIAQANTLISFRNVLFTHLPQVYNFLFQYSSIS